MTLAKTASAPCGKKYYNHQLSPYPTTDLDVGSDIRAQEAAAATDPKQQICGDATTHTKDWPQTHFRQHCSILLSYIPELSRLYLAFPNILSNHTE
jgi:hypothetical protein